MHKLKIILALTMVMAFALTSCNKEQLSHADENIPEITDDLSIQSRATDYFDVEVNGCNVTVSFNDAVQSSWEIFFEVLDDNFNILHQQTILGNNCPNSCSYTFNMNECGDFQAGGFVKSSAGTVWGFDYDDINIPRTTFKGVEICFCSLGSVGPVGPGNPRDER